MTPDEELRLAAKLMRERAEVSAPGPWTVVTPEKFGDLTLIQGADWAVARSASYEAPYIASMHPGVALAVADWLEDAADEIIQGTPGAFPVSSTFRALAVARAYLGTDSEGVEG